MHFLLQKLAQSRILYDLSLLQSFVSATLTAVPSRSGSFFLFPYLDKKTPGNKKNSAVALVSQLSGISLCDLFYTLSLSFGSLVFIKQIFLKISFRIR
jgi:hypothetical protein